MGFKVLPSEANFFMVHIRRQVQTVIDEFRARGVLVGRPFPPMLRASARVCRHARRDAAVSQRLQGNRGAENAGLMAAEDSARMSIRLGLPLTAALLAFADAMSHGSVPQTASGPPQGDRRVVAPAFEVDPFWPKPLPNRWILGSTIGLAVDARDHVFVLHRQSSIDVDFKAAALDPPLGACCIPAPPVLEFSADGTLVNSWGGPGQGYDWPLREHGLSIDHKGNVWIGGNDDKDSQVLKFTSAGRFVLQIGRPGQKKRQQRQGELLEARESVRRSRGE